MNEGRRPHAPSTPSVASRPAAGDIEFARYLTPPQAADVTQLSVKTILKAIRQGHLVAARVGNRVRIRPDALQAWLERAEGGRP